MLKVHPPKQVMTKDGTAIYDSSVVIESFNEEEKKIVSQRSESSLLNESPSRQLFTRKGQIKDMLLNNNFLQNQKINGTQQNFTKATITSDPNSMFNKQQKTSNPYLQKVAAKNYVAPIVIQGKLPSKLVDKSKYFPEAYQGVPKKSKMTTLPTISKRENQNQDIGQESITINVENRLKRTEQNGSELIKKRYDLPQPLPLQTLQKNAVNNTGSLNVTPNKDFATFELQENSYPIKSPDQNIANNTIRNSQDVRVRKQLKSQVPISQQSFKNIAKQDSNSNQNSKSKLVENDEATLKDRLQKGDKSQKLAELLRKESDFQTAADLSKSIEDYYEDQLNQGQTVDALLVKVQELTLQIDQKDKQIEQLNSNQNGKNQDQTIIKQLKADLQAANLQLADKEQKIQQVNLKVQTLEKFNTERLNLLAENQQLKQQISNQNPSHTIIQLKGSQAKAVQQSKKEDTADNRIVNENTDTHKAFEELKLQTEKEVQKLASNLVAEATLRFNEEKEKLIKQIGQLETFKRESIVIVNEKQVLIAKNQQDFDIIKSTLNKEIEQQRLKFAELTLQNSNLNHEIEKIKKETKNQLQVTNQADKKKQQDYEINDSDYNSRPKTSQRKNIEQIILESQSSMQLLLDEKTQEIQYLNQKIFQLDKNWSVIKNHKGCQANRKIKGRDQSSQTKILKSLPIKISNKDKLTNSNGNLVAELKEALGRNVDLEEIEQALEDIRQQFHTAKKDIGDGDTSFSSFDQISSLSQRNKKPLHEKIDEIQTLLKFSEVPKERRILKNREIHLLREWYTIHKHMAGSIPSNQADLAKENEQLKDMFDEQTNLLNQREEEIEKLYEQLDEQASKSEKEIEKLRSKISSLFAEIDQLRDEVVLSELPSKREKEIVKEVEIREVPDPISIEKLRSVENELLQLKFENEDLFAKISYQDQQLKSANNQVQDTQDELSEVSLKLEDAEERARQLSFTVLQLKSQIPDSNQQLELTETLLKLEDAELKNNQFNNTLQQLRNEIPDTKAQIHKYVAEVMPHRFLVYEIFSAESLKRFVQERARPEESLMQCFDRVLKDYFLVPEDYRILLLKEPDCFKSIVQMLAMPGRKDHNSEHVFEQLLAMQPTETQLVNAYTQLQVKLKENNADYKTLFILDRNRPIERHDFKLQLQEILDEQHAGFIVLSCLQLTQNFSFVTLQAFQALNQKYAQQKKDLRSEEREEKDQKLSKQTSPFGLDTNTFSNQQKKNISEHFFSKEVKNLIMANSDLIYLARTKQNLRLSCRVLCVSSQELGVNGEKTDIEIVFLKDLLPLLHKTEGIDQLLSKMEALVQTANGQVIKFDVLISGLQLHGYNIMSAMPNIKGLEFEFLLPKSHRTLNRMSKITVKYLQQYKEKAVQNPGALVPTIAQIVSAIFKGKIERMKIQKRAGKDYNSQTSQGGFEEVQLIPAQKFTEALVALQIVKSKNVNNNLIAFIKFNEQNKDMVMLKKLQKVIEEYMANQLLKSYGIKKSKLSAIQLAIEEEKEEEYEYYEEDESPKNEDYQTLDYTSLIQK